jgi:hypothetical protein
MDAYAQCLVSVSEDGTYYFTANCRYYSGKPCPHTVHLWWPSSESQALVMRHGEGEARRDFLFDEWIGRGVVEEWLQSIHEYEA